MSKKIRYLKIDALEIGACYALDARNINCGVWDGTNFYGVRHNHLARDHYLFPEGHWDAGGTAKPIRKLK